MNTIEKSHTPDGVEICLRDWSTNYSCRPKNSDIASYPIAKATSAFGFIRAGSTFLCSFSFPNEKKARKAFQQLEKGEKKLEDFIKYVNYPWEIKCLLGEGLRENAEKR